MVLPDNLEQWMKNHRAVTEDEAACSESMVKWIQKIPSVEDRMKALDVFIEVFGG